MKMGLKRLRKILLLLVTIMMIFPSIVFGAEDIYAEVKIQQMNWLKFLLMITVFQEFSTH